MEEQNIKTITSDKLLSGFATLFLVLMIFTGIILIATSGAVTRVSEFDSYGENGFSITFIMMGLGAMVNGVFIFALLKGFSDIVYLLKQQVKAHE